MPASGSRRITPLTVIIVVILAALVAYAVFVKSTQFRNTKASVLPRSEAAAPQQATVPNRQQPSTGPESNEQQNSANEVGGTEDTGANTSAAH